MTTKTLFKRLAIFFFFLAATLPGMVCAAESASEFPFKTGDRVEWVGSSSTRIGTWCRTLEFLLRTRHPELQLTFNRGTTGGGTFLTGIKNLPLWLGEFKPTVVVFNYGANDAGAGVKGIPFFKQNMQKCKEMVEDTGARVLFTAHQSGDIRVTSKQAFDQRKLYAETILTFAHENGWTIYDAYHPIEEFQLACQKDVPDFTINKDRIHLTDSAYIAWGFYLYERMSPPVVESSVELNADGKVIDSKNCRVSDVTTYSSRGLEFVRADSVLPLIPPSPIPAGNLLKAPVTSIGAATGTALKDAIKDSYKLGVAGILAERQFADKLFIDSAFARLAALAGPFLPPKSAPTNKIPPAQVAFALKNGQKLPSRALVPMEKFSRYMLKIAGLDAGQYEVSCENMPIGVATEKELAAGVNLNTLLLDSQNPAPWGELVKNLWIGKRLDEIGKTKWKFRVEKK